MPEALVCSNCGAPLGRLENGACPYCHVLLAGHEPTPGVIDARGPVWRVVIWTGGRKPKKVWRALEQATDLGDRARPVVGAATREQPKIVVQDVAGSQATTVFQQLIAAGGTGSLERREGTTWIVVQSSDLIAEFQRQHP